MGKSSTLEPRKFFLRFKLPFKTINMILLTDEGLTLGTSALETLCGGKFTLLTQMMKPNYLVIPQTDVAPHFP